MIRNSKKAKAVIIANQKGYIVNDDGIVYNKDKNIVNGWINSNGYKVFGIRNKDNINFHVKVHQLMAYQKYGMKALYKNICVRHLDGNPLNNSKNNIVIGSYSDNMMDQLKEIRVKKAFIATAKVRKYDKVAKDIRRDRDGGMKYKDLMIKYNISSKGTLNFILKHSQY